MASVITREIIEIIASMQAKALAFDSEHPNHPLGKRSAAEYGAAIRALVPISYALARSCLRRGLTPWGC